MGNSNILRISFFWPIQSPAYRWLQNSPGTTVIRYHGHLHESKVSKTAYEDNAPRPRGPSVSIPDLLFQAYWNAASLQPPWTAPLCCLENCPVTISVSDTHTLGGDRCFPSSTWAGVTQTLLAVPSPPSCPSSCSAFCICYSQRWPSSLLLVSK